MPDIAYLNGVYCGVADAKVSIEDRGFQFADGVYEVIVAQGGKPFRMAEHLERLTISSDAIGLVVDFLALDLPSIVADGIRRCGYDDVMVYIQITRGVASREHVYRGGSPPTVVVTFKRAPVYDDALRQKGVELETVRDTRWAMCSVKSIALLANVLLKNAARRRGYFDAVIVSHTGIVREATAANVFIVSQGVLRTPPASDFILHGVTRAFVLECARELRLEVREEDFSVDELRSANEVFITSTTMEMMPVTKIDGQPVGSSLPGEITQRLYARVRQH